MTETKQWTKEQLANAETMAKKMAELPPDKQATVAMMASAFIAGMEAQARMEQAKT